MRETVVSRRGVAIESAREVIEGRLEELESAATGIGCGCSVPNGLRIRLTDFFVEFVDRSYNELVEAATPADAIGPTMELHALRVDGRGHLEALLGALDQPGGGGPAMLRAWARAAHSYADVLREQLDLELLVLPELPTSPGRAQLGGAA